MKKIKKVVALIIYTILVAIGNWPGSGSKDPWDELMDWAKREKKK